MQRLRETPTPTKNSDYARYQQDPVAFGEQILGESYTEDVKRMMESVRDNVITVAQSGNGTGKTHGAARIATWFYKCFPDSQVYTAAAPPEDNLKRLLWGEIGDLQHKHPDVFKGDKLNVLHVGRSPLSFLCGVTIPMSGDAKTREAKFSGKHAPYLLFIIDEGDAVPDEVYQGIESCMSGGHVRLLIMFNPRQKKGAVYRKVRGSEDEKEANVVRLTAFTHPNVVSGEDRIPGAVDRETTVRRINMWTRPLSQYETIGAECFHLPAFLEGATCKKPGGGMFAPLAAGTYKIVEPAFSYMVLGQYPAQGSAQLISEEWVNRARARWDAYVAQNGEKPPIGTRGTMGLDVADLGDDLNCVCMRYGGFVPRLKTWGGVDPTVTVERAVLEYQHMAAMQVCVDSIGVGASVAPAMAKRKCVAHRVMVSEKATIKSELGEFGILRDQLWWQVREWLRTDPGAMLPPDEELTEELTVPTYGMDKGKLKIMAKDTMKELLKRSPNKADALGLTFYEPEILFQCLME